MLYAGAFQILGHGWPAKSFGGDNYGAGGDWVPVCRRRGWRGCATILRATVSSYLYQRIHCRTSHSIFSGFKFWGLTCPGGHRSCGLRKWCTRVYSPSSNRIGMIVITAPPALGQRDGWSGLDWIRCLIDGYDMEARFGSQCGVLGRSNLITGRQGMLALSRHEWSKLRNLTRAWLRGCMANAAAGCNKWLWGGCRTLTFTREWQLAAT